MCWREESSLNPTDPHPGLRNRLFLGYQVKFIQDEHTTLMSPENPVGDEGGDVGSLGLGAQGSRRNQVKGEEQTDPPEMLERQGMA